MNRSPTFECPKSSPSVEPSFCVTDALACAPIESWNADWERYVDTLVQMPTGYLPYPGFCKPRG